MGSLPAQFARAIVRALSTTLARIGSLRNDGVSSEGGSISVTDQTGATKTILESDLSSVTIETNDTGPWGADLWWLFFDPEDQLACAFPQGAAGEQAVIDYLLALPQFDHEAMIGAMGSVANAAFPVWRRAS